MGIDPQNSLYATRAEVLEYAFLPTMKDEEIQESAILRTSRLIDTYIEVAPGYFAPACEAETRSFRGTGDRFLELPPHVPNSIDDVRYADGSMTPEYFEQDDYLIANQCWQTPCCCGCCGPLPAAWNDCQVIEITARWGFAQVPADITEACIETVIAMWRNRDSAYARVVVELNTNQTVINPALPDRAKLICDRWRRKNKAVIV